MGFTAKSTFTPRNDLGQFIQTNVTPGVRASTSAAGALIRDTAKELCPVRTGELRDSIDMTVEDTGKTVRAVVEASAAHADYVEFGTGRRGAESPGAGAGPYSPTWPGMPAQPYMRPALDQSREAILELYRGNISTGKG